jgi:hypothetical protein
METGEQLQRRATGASTSLSIGTLHPDYTYTYSVSALTAVGMGPLSASRSIRLPEDGEESAQAHALQKGFVTYSIEITTFYQYTSIFLSN